MTEERNTARLPKQTVGTGKPPVLLKTQPALSKVSGILANATGDGSAGGRLPNSLPAFPTQDRVSNPESVEFHATIQKYGGSFNFG